MRRFNQWLELVCEEWELPNSLKDEMFNAFISLMRAWRENDNAFEEEQRKIGNITLTYSNDGYYINYETESLSCWAFLDERAPWKIVRKRKDLN